VSKPDNEAEILRQKIKFPLKDTVAASTKGGDNAESVIADTELTNVTLSHVLTNVVVLQNFMVELVALMQLRASLFEEIRFN